MIYVYGKEHCPACRQTEMYLNSHAVSYLYKKIVDDQGNPLGDEATKLITYFKQQGYKQFPVVTVAPGGCLVNEFCGFKPSELADTVTMWNETSSHQTSLEQIHEYDNLHGYRGAPGINPNIDVDTLNNL